MKQFLRGRRELPKVCMLPMIFCVLFSAIAALPAFGQEADGLTKVSNAQARKYNYKLYEAVKVKPIISEQYTRDMLARHPKADLNKFPMQEYLVDTIILPRVQVGELLPDELLDLPLWVTNDAYGRDTLTLRSEMDREWLVLDVWDEWCPPCLKSMNKLEKYANEQGSNLTLIGLYPSFYPHRACYEARKRGYNSIQIIGSSCAVIKQMLLGYTRTVGPAIWIKNGRLFGATNAEALTDTEYRQLMSGEMGRIPEHAAFKGLR